MITQTASIGTKINETDIENPKVRKTSRGSENFHEFMNAFSRWMKSISTPAFHEFQRLRITNVLYSDLITQTIPIDDFRFPQKVERQHNVATSFFHLYDAAKVLSQCEHYFKRYPFDKREVSRSDHARNMCEFYLGNVYVLRNRLKVFLNNSSKTCPELQLNVPATLKSFDRVFDQELRMRNGVTHHEPFSDIDIERISLTQLLSQVSESKDAGFGAESQRTYRKFAESWARRAKQRAEIVGKLVDEIAGHLTRASFLSVSNSPPS